MIKVRIDFVHMFSLYTAIIILYSQITTVKRNVNAKICDF